MCRHQTNHKVFCYQQVASKYENLTININLSGHVFHICPSIIPQVARFEAGMQLGVSRIDINDSVLDNPIYTGVNVSGGPLDFLIILSDVRFPSSYIEYIFQ